MPAELKMTPEMKQKVIKMFSEGHPIQNVAKELGVSISAIQSARLADPLFDSNCGQARTKGYDVQADSLLTIAETIQDVNKARLTSDNIKWTLARRDPSRFGDRIEVNMNQTVDIGSALKEAKSRVLPTNQIIENQVTMQVIDIVRSSNAIESDSQSDEMPKSGDAGDSDDSDIFD